METIRKLIRSMFASVPKGLVLLLSVLIICLILSIYYLSAVYSIILLLTVIGLFCWMLNITNENHSDSTDIQDLKEQINHKEALITELHNLIRQLNSGTTKPQPLISTPISDTDKELLQGHVDTFLKMMQLLDITSMDFGDECHRYVRKEVEKAALKCGYHFVDYMDSTADCYDVEYVTNQQDIYYVSRAIIKNADNQVVLKGHIYLPKNNQS